MKPVVIGVLALQGDFTKHIEVLYSLGVEVKEVRKPTDLEGCEGLIIPGGESTVMVRQIDFIKLRDPLKQFAGQKPVFGTCAGLILMSKNIKNDSLKTLDLLDILVERNAFGRQIESFQVPIELRLSPESLHLFEAFFIRAPRIRANDPKVEILATYKDEPVLVKQGHHLGASFHPELTSDPLIHTYFLDYVRKNRHKI
jgi:5'-phosphate synthase pdxT subunit